MFQQLKGSFPGEEQQAHGIQGGTEFNNYQLSV
jgi:hypothetical protein